MNLSDFKKKKRVVAVLLGLIILFSCFMSSGDSVKAAEITQNKIRITQFNGVDYSRVYDFDYYINRYEDLKKAFGNDDVAALKHFIKYGMREGRQAKETFDVFSYKNANQDLRKAFGNDLRKYYEHYMIWGYKERRVSQGVNVVQNPVTVMDGVDYSKVYDYYFYIEKYADLKKAFGNDDIAALKHFIVHGMREGRQAKETFDVYSYKNAYRDLRTAFGGNLRKYYEHYMIWGYREQRVSQGVDVVQDPVTELDGVDYSKVYDYYYYIDRHPDLKKAFGNDDVAALKHFIKYGMKEGRRASFTFDPAAYKANYADLRKAFGTSNESNKQYYLHYMKYGERERRNAITVEDRIIEDKNSDIIFVGDSRFVLMSEACEGMEGSYVCKYGMGLVWLQTKLPTLYNEKGKKIVINMGVNDLGNIERYLEFYNTLPDDFVADNKVIIMTVNPVDEAVGKKFGIYTTNASINVFNERMKKGLRNDMYILDSNSYMTRSGFEAYDGLHYSENTSRALHRWAVNECKLNRFIQR